MLNDFRRSRSILFCSASNYRLLLTLIRLRPPSARDAQEKQSLAPPILYQLPSNMTPLFASISPYLEAMRSESSGPKSSASTEFTD